MNRCTKNKLKRLRELGVKTNGTIESMIRLITNKGFGLPGEHIEEFKEFVEVFPEGGEPYEQLQDVPRHYYGFQLQRDTCYVRIALTYADALADELILLKQLQLI